MKSLRATGMPAFLQRLALADILGLSVTIVGIILVAAYYIIRGDFYGIASIIRVLGLLFVVCGIAAVVFGSPRRRDALFRAAASVVAQYLAVTGHWGWPDRVGLAAVAIGVALLIVGIVVGILFGTSELVTAGLLIALGGGVMLLLGGPGRRAVAWNLVKVVVIIIVGILRALFSILGYLFSRGSSGGGSSGGGSSGGGSPGRPPPRPPPGGRGGRGRPRGRR